MTIDTEYTYRQLVTTAQCIPRMAHDRLMGDTRGVSSTTSVMVLISMVVLLATSLASFMLIAN
jgi:hypothetical protein